MDERTFEHLETRLRNTARHFPYPATPDISRVEAVRRVTRRGGRSRLQWRIAWVAASVLVIILLAALATPTVRAAVLEFIQIGVVRIFQTAPTPLPEVPRNRYAVACRHRDRLHPPRRPSPLPLIWSRSWIWTGKPPSKKHAQRSSFPIRLPILPGRPGPA